MINIWLEGVQGLEKRPIVSSELELELMLSLAVQVRGQEQHLHMSPKVQLYTTGCGLHVYDPTWHHCTQV